MSSRVAPATGLELLPVGLERRVAELGEAARVRGDEFLVHPAALDQVAQDAREDRRRRRRC